MNLRRAIPLGVVAILAACAPAAPEPDLTPIPVEYLRERNKIHQRYIDALLLCGSTSPRDWEEARRQLEILNYRVFDEDPELIQKFRQGDEKARVELGRRGLILDALVVFAKGYNKSKWDNAHKILMDAGQPGQILLSTTLVQILKNGQFHDDWDHVRSTLVETGPVALETVIGWARMLAEQTPADTAVFRIEDLTQAAMALIWFGEKGMPALGEYATSPKPNVRRACARAIGEARHVPSVSLLVRMVGEDGDWTVRTSAAEALGRLGGAKAVAGRALLARVGVPGKVERERIVLKTVIGALGALKYEEAVPALMGVLDYPDVEMASQAINSLYHITGLRLTRKEQWLQWYAADYKRWKEGDRR